MIGPIVAGSLFEFTGVGAPYVLGAVLALLALALVPTGPVGRELVPARSERGGARTSRVRGYPVSSGVGAEHRRVERRSAAPSSER